MEQYVSIQVTRESKRAWEGLKNHPDEAIENMLNRYIRLAHEDDSEFITEEDIREMEESMSEIRNGEYVTDEHITRKYKL